MSPEQKRRPARGGADLFDGDRHPLYPKTAISATPLPGSIVAVHWYRPAEHIEARA